MTSGKVLGKAVLLVIVLALIGFLYVQTLEQPVNVEIENGVKEVEVGQTQVLLEITKEVEKPVNRQIVTNRFTQEIDKDGVVVVVDGSNAYFVRRGAVIVDNNIIKVSDEEYSVDFTESPRRIISSN